MARSKFKQGIYNPLNPGKYKGNNASPVYRSALERKFFYYFDNNPNVVAWASESIIVPYYNPVDRKNHRYYVDLIAAIKDHTGKVTKYLIEVKPYSQTFIPTPSSRKKPSTVMYENLMYNQNKCKWEAASAYAEQKGMKFIVLTEKYLADS